MHQDIFSRRSILRSAGLLGASVVAGSPLSRAAEGEQKAGLSFRNEDFYGADGKFDEAKAKDAIVKLMEYHKYPVFPDAKEKLWVSDYGLGQFTKLGLAARMFINEQEGCYMVMDIYLLPNQMLPEHWHEKTDKAPAKREGWVCRNGLSYVYGEGEPTKDIHAVIPEFEKSSVMVFHETILTPGQSTNLVRATSRHWQFAGPEGVILTESATFHDNNAVHHSDPKIKFP